MRVVETGEVIAEIDADGKFVDLWVVTIVEVHATLGIIPYRARRSCRPRSADEMWAGRRWRPSLHDHRFLKPEGPR